MVMHGCITISLKSSHSPLNCRSLDILSIQFKYLHSDAQFELQQVVLNMSTFLNVYLSKCMKCPVGVSINT